ncbi:MAG: DUF2851 family protein [Fluviicola sp.]|nr:DUF2851 family protein [Fluviicola sp.]
MNENYLHLIWKTKRLPFHLLQTIDKKEVKILHVGIYNTASGPDFFNGQIEIDGVRHSGNIEMHIKSSDWYAHKHHEDRAYDNVILHVVYEHDQLVFIEGIEIPTIELKEHIDWAHYKQVHQFSESKSLVHCASSLNDCPPPIFWNQVEVALLDRLNRKAQELHESQNEVAPNPKEVLFQALAKSFGCKTNALPFMELSQRLPFERFMKCSLPEKQALVFGTAGFLEQQPSDDYQLQLTNEWRFQRARLSIQAAKKESWKFKGCRPPGFPTIRLAQFANFIHRMDWSEAFWELPTRQLLDAMYSALLAPIDAYWLNHVNFGIAKKDKVSTAMSKATAQLIIVNSIVPFLFWLSKRLANSAYREKGLEILEMLPAEKNVRLDYWKQLGIEAKSAADAQGLLELLSQWCEKKLCLKCRVGQHTLGQKQ